MTINALTKEKENSWNNFVNNHPDGKFVHLSNYKYIIEQTYGYKGHFLYAEEKNDILAIFPFFQFKNLFFKNKFVSQPFNEYGGLLFRENLSEKQKSEILSLFYSYLGKLFPGQKKFFIEIHGQQNEEEFLKKHLTKIPLYQIAVLKLKSYDEVYENFDYQIKKAVNKAKKTVIIRDELSPKTIKENFYPLYAAYLKRRHGTPPYPLNFFLNCCNYAPKNVKLLLAEMNNKTIAALWGFIGSKGMQINYNPSLSKYLIYRPNDLLHAKLIEWACKNNLQYFDFGPARYSGQINFKKKWGVGFMSYSYFYFSKTPIKFKPLTADSKSVKIMNFLCKHLIPTSLVKLTGPFFRQKMGK